MTNEKKKKILFVCIGNMCRSPIAEGFARHEGSDVVEACSAGIHPTGQISHDAMHVMEELEIDISDLRSNGLNEVPLDEIDMVVSMTGFPARDYLPGSYDGVVIDWKIDDPIGRSLSTFHRVRDEIKVKIDDLLEDIRRANFSSSK
jgi:arsenate reductase